MKDLLSGIVILVMFAGAPVMAGDTVDHRAELEEYVQWRYGHMRPSIPRNARELIEPTLKHCEHYKVDPLLMAVIFHNESSWRNFEGALGEVGPGHVLPNSKIKKRFPLNTLDGQIEASVWRWSFAQGACPSLERAFTHYARGTCQGGTEKTRNAVKRRVRQYQKAVERFRK